MTTFFTSDLHFGHANIIGYCGRPATTVDDMNTMLIDNWNDTVDPSDTVFVLGDVALGRIADTLPLVSLLHGDKYLVPGNHDRCWNNTSPRWAKAYTEAGFTILPNLYHLNKFLLCHFPYSGDSRHKERYLEHRPKDEGEWLLHGHVHDTWKVNGRQINVGVDVWDYKPVPLDLLLAIATPRTGAGEQLP